MQTNPLLQLARGFLFALVLMALPWALPFMVRDVGLLVVPVSIVLSGAALLFLLLRYALIGELYAAIGVLLVPAGAWLAFDLGVIRPASRATAECADDATPVRPANSNAPRYVILDNFDMESRSYMRADVGSMIAILTGAQVVSGVDSNKFGQLVATLKADRIEECRVARDSREKGYWNSHRHSETIDFENGKRKVDRCMIERSVERAAMDRSPAVVFRHTHVGGACWAIDAFERDARGGEVKLGRIKFDRTRQTLHPDLRRPGDDPGGALFVAARAVLGESISIAGLRRHFRD